MQSYSDDYMVMERADDWLAIPIWGDGKTELTWAGFLEALKELIRRKAAESPNPMREIEKEWEDMTGKAIPPIRQPEDVVDTWEVLDSITTRVADLEDFPIPIKAAKEWPDPSLPDLIRELLRT